MTKNEYGVWEITIPPTSTGECAIPHDSKIKVREHLMACSHQILIKRVPQISLILPHGARVERIPAWITRVTQDLSISPVYDARFWNPPESERYKFKNKSPPKPRSARIYEAHVGISTSESRVGTYKEFTRDTLPRIRDLGYNVIQLMAVMEHAYYACKLGPRKVYERADNHVCSLWIPSDEFLRRKLAIRPPGGLERAHRRRTRDGHHSPA